MNISLYDLPLIPIKSLKAWSSMFFKPSGYEQIKGNGNAVEYVYKGRRVRLATDAVRPDQLKNIMNEIFVIQPYMDLDVKDKVVIDIGASIGDTAIYFALNGARHVYAIEPANSDRLKWIRKNAEQNGVAGKITVVKGMYNKVSLADLIKKYKLGSNLVLKMDCEGGEYGLLKETGSTLSKFSQIDIEYHYGYRNLLEHLGKGFELEHTVPFYFPRHNMLVGYIRGTKSKRIRRL
ncbi:MAG: FkbM family methyltransferase [Candidatus Micrarchaeota archaeon]|nr:FkbM family methyltransferase [Candidatus Micrarchaeota archaeon]